jgi:hypothetical protein
VREAALINFAGRSQLIQSIQQGLIGGLEAGQGLADLNQSIQDLIGVHGTQINLDSLSEISHG